MEQQKIIILDFGSQTTQLIGRRLRELGTFCEILPYDKFSSDDRGIIGVILSGSPFSVYDPDAFKVDLSPIRGRYPILGICYGAQYMAQLYGGSPVQGNSAVQIWKYWIRKIHCSAVSGTVHKCG